MSICRGGIIDRINNNVLERHHETYRERDKVMRGLEGKETVSQMLENYRTYYNFVRSIVRWMEKCPQR